MVTPVRTCFAVIPLDAPPRSFEYGVYVLSVLFLLKRGPSELFEAVKKARENAPSSVCFLPFLLPFGGKIGLLYPDLGKKITQRGDRIGSAAHRPPANKDSHSTVR